MATGIQIGASTHNHDHAITFNNFKTIKTIANRPPKPIPLTFVSAILTLFYQINLALAAYPVVRLNVALVVGRYSYPPPAEEVALYVHAPVLVYNSQCLHDILFFTDFYKPNVLAVRAAKTRTLTLWTGQVVARIVASKTCVPRILYLWSLYTLQVDPVAGEDLPYRSSALLYDAANLRL